MVKSRNKILFLFQSFWIYFYLLIIIIIGIVSTNAMAAKRSPIVQIGTSGSLNFYIAAQGPSTYFQTLEQFTFSKGALFWPYKHLGIGGFYIRNFLIKQLDISYGPRLEFRLGGFFLGINYGILESNYLNASIDSRQGYLITLDLGARVHFLKYMYFTGSLVYLSKTYKKENGEDMIINLYKDIALPFIGFGFSFPGQK